MKKSKGIFLFIILFPAFSLHPRLCLAADYKNGSSHRMRKAQALLFASEYTKDLRKKIEEEKKAHERAAKKWGKLELHQSWTLKNEFAARVSQPREFTKIKNQLFLSESRKVSDELRFKVSGRLYYNAVFDLTNNYKRNIKSDEAVELELRDTYIDYSRGPWDIRIGKQQIVWGEAVALFFADVVNAKDLREFVLPDFDLIRIPQWGVDTEYSKNSFHAEFVWLPFLEFDKLPVSGSEFALPYPMPSAATPFTYSDPGRPKDSLDNSEIGLRLSYLLNSWDLSLFYLHTYNRSPVYYRTINSGVYNFTPKYKRLDVFGLTFAREINDVIFKGEFVFNKNDYFSILDAADSDGVVRRNVFNYLLGVDYTFFEKIDTALQFMQRLIFDYPDMLFGEKELRNSVALWIKTGFFDNRLEPELTFVTSLMETDLMYRPRINLRFTDNCKLRCGLDIFEGTPTGIFGKFDAKSRIYSELTFTF